MPRKRSVVVASVVSGALFAASFGFAVATGLFGRTQADAVGSFQAIEARVTSPSGTVAPGWSAVDDEHDEHDEHDDHDDARVRTSAAPTTSTTVVHDDDHRDDGHVRDDHADDGHEDDD